MRNYSTLAEAVLAIDPRNERSFRCEVHQDRQASASVNVLLGVWVCYACGAAGRVDGTLIDHNAENLLEEIGFLDEEPEHHSEQMLKLYTTDTPNSYWLGRFSTDACNNFKLGFDHASGQPVYPIYDEANNYLGVVRRNFDRAPKYRYPKGIKIHQLLYNYFPSERPSVVLVEGAMDTVACWDAGVDAFGLYGSKFSPAQRDLVLKCSPYTVYTVFDNDHAGEKCTAQVRELLEPYGVNVRSFDWKYYPIYNDIAELELELRRAALQQLLAV